MTRYCGMDRTNGGAINDTDHLRQSVQDILLTPIGSRLARREYGSLLLALIDEPQGPVLRLRLMAAVYVALTRWEPRLILESIQIITRHDGQVEVVLNGQRHDGAPAAFSVAMGGAHGRD
ncbi:GPW/gp25 family protein [Edwardsiella tarda]|uniref:GPW/gp25 family protein n=1 Tax=Edwardsiella tarda TaxID=636 RepID=UPI0002FBED5E|nr:GPW/gp25 family protein [Edwardsiella tarda]